MDTQNLNVLKSRATLTKIILGVVVIGVLAGGYYLYGNLKSTAPITTQTGPQVVSVPAGSLTAGFPSELLLEKGVSVKESYAVNYAKDGISQLVANYVSAQSMIKNISMFKDYLLTNQWSISHEGDLAYPVTYFAATKGTESVNITLVADAKANSVTVTIAYVNKAK